MLLLIKDRRLRAFYVRRFAAALRNRPDGVLLRLYAVRCALHFHLHELTRRLRSRDGGLINTY
jgi:hypothetical protein